MGRKKETKAAAKTIRTRESTKFGILFWARHQGMTANAYVEAACDHYSDVLEKKHGLPWRDIWHVEPAICELQMYKLDAKHYPFSDDQLRRRHFVMMHRQFFYNDDAKANGFNVSIPRAVLLVPRIEEFMKTPGNAWAPGLAMAKALKEHGLNAPEWPPKEAK